MRLREENAELRRVVADLRKVILTLQERIATLEQDSSTSSKPPSSDPPFSDKAADAKHPPQKPKKPKPRGGHERRVRTPFPPERIHRRFEHRDSRVNPSLWEPVPEEPDHPEGDPAWSVLQQIDFHKKESRFVVTEHRFRVYRRIGDPTRTRTTPRPAHLRPGRPGSGLFATGMIAYVNTARWQLRASLGGLQRFLLDTLDLGVSTGYLAKVLDAMTQPLKEAYEHIREAVRGAKEIYADETSHRETTAEGTKLSYSWCVSSLIDRITLLAVGRGRATAELEQILDHPQTPFRGVIHSDHYGVDGKYAREHESVVSQYCWAHFVREVRGAGRLPGKGASVWSAAMERASDELFAGWHRGDLPACRRARDSLLQKCEWWMPWANQKIDNLRKRLIKESQSYFRFIETPGNLKDRRIQPTNNHAERSVRPLVMLRGVTQGTRSERGRRWWERVGSVAMTLRQRKAGLFDFLEGSLRAAARGIMPPTPLVTTVPAE